jgi:hypothetical protein
MILSENIIKSHQDIQRLIDHGKIRNEMELGISEAILEMRDVLMRCDSMGIDLNDYYINFDLDDTLINDSLFYEDYHDESGLLATLAKKEFGGLIMPVYNFYKFCESQSFRRGMKMRIVTARSEFWRHTTLNNLSSLGIFRPLIIFTGVKNKQNIFMQTKNFVCVGDQSTDIAEYSILGIKLPNFYT